jgi:hypothetical protein
MPVVTSSCLSSKIDHLDEFSWRKDYWEQILQQPGAILWGEKQIRSHFELERLAQIFTMQLHVCSDGSFVRIVSLTLTHEEKICRIVSSTLRQNQGRFVIFETPVSLSLRQGPKTAL